MSQAQAAEAATELNKTGDRTGEAHVGGGVDNLMPRLRSLRIRLESALANRTEEGDAEAVSWLSDGLEALRGGIDRAGMANIMEELWRDSETECERLASGLRPSDTAIAEAFHEHRMERERSLPPWSEVQEGSGIWQHSHNFAARLASLPVAAATPSPAPGAMADLRALAVAWHQARLTACAAPMGDKSVWTSLGAAETALSAYVRNLIASSPTASAPPKVDDADDLRERVQQLQQQLAEEHYKSQQMSRAFWESSAGDDLLREIGVPETEIAALSGARTASAPPRVDGGIVAAQVTLGEGLVDITRIDHEGRSGVLFRPRAEHIPFGRPGELPEGEYWPVAGDVVLWVSGEGPQVAIDALAALSKGPRPAAGAEGLVEAAQTVMDALNADCVDGEPQYPDDPAYNLDDRGATKLTTGMVAGLRDALARHATPQGAGETAGGDRVEAVAAALFEHDERERDPKTDGVTWDQWIKHAEQFPGRAVREIESYRSRARAALATAAPEQAGSRGWPEPRPINEAPRDGTCVAIWRPGWLKPVAAFWGLAPMAACGFGATNTYPWVFLDETNGLNTAGCDHSMVWWPLPEPPAAARPHSDAEGRR